MLLVHGREDDFVPYEQVKVWSGAQPFMSVPGCDAAACEACPHSLLLTKQPLQQKLARLNPHVWKLLLIDEAHHYDLEYMFAT